MSKKICTLLLAACALVVSGTCFAQITTKEAIEIGRKEVPAIAVICGTENEPTEIKVFFFDNSTNRNYEVEIDAITGKVKELEIVGSQIVGSTTVLKTTEDIRKIVLEKYPDAQNLVIKKEKEGNNTVFEAEFSTPKYSEVEMKLNPVTGAIGKEELKYR